MVDLGCRQDEKGLDPTRGPFLWFPQTVIEAFSFFALFQSSRKRFRPMSVSGCMNIFSMTSAGIVPMSAPILQLAPRGWGA